MAVAGARAMRLAALSLPDDLVRFFERHAGFSEAWNACERPEWLVELALHAGVDRRIVVVLTVPVVERALERHSFRTDAVGVARRWARGKAAGAVAWAAGFRASEEAKKHEGEQAAALRAAGALAFACDGSSAPEYYAIRGHLVDATALAMQSMPEEASAFAGALRRGLPLPAIEEALRARVQLSQPPTRSSGERRRKPYSWHPPVAAGDDEPGA